MTVRELWNVSPQCFLFIRRPDGKVYEYKGHPDAGKEKVQTVLATSYPMYRHVLEVTTEEE